MNLTDQISFSIHLIERALLIKIYFSRIFLIEPELYTQKKGFGYGLRKIYI
jgi:hypothetical protein